MAQARTDLGQVLQAAKGEPALLEELIRVLDDFEDTPVSIDEFIDSPRFLAGYFEDLEGGFSPFWRKVLRTIFPSPYLSPYWLIALRGAIGIAKTTTACVILLYDLHLMLCSRNPQVRSGLVKSELVLFAIFNITKSNTSVAWDKMFQMMLGSPYFYAHIQKYFNNSKRSPGQTMFPKRIDILLGSRTFHSLGKAIYEALLDEANFGIIKDQVYDVFNSTLRRMQTRFGSADQDNPAGRLIVVSSETDSFSTLNNIIARYKNDPGVLIIGAAHWEVFPHKYPKERFPVYIGSEQRQPYIITDKKDKILTTEPTNVVWVPTNLRLHFEADVGKALRDLAGRPVGSKYKLFTNAIKLNEAMQVPPLFPDIIHLDQYDDSDQIMNYLLHPGYFKSKPYKGAVRVVHIDIGLTGDRLGIGCALLGGFRDKEIFDPVTLEKVVESMPDTLVEWAFTLEAKGGQQIPLFKVRIFLAQVMQQRIQIARVTADGFASEDMLQLMERHNCEVEVLSVDKTATPYSAFRNAVNDGRCALPNSPLLKRELLDLEITPDGKKVDHPPDSLIDGQKGSKDLADGVCGSTVILIREADKYRYSFMKSDAPVSGRIIRSEADNKLFWSGKSTKFDQR